MKIFKRVGIMGLALMASMMMLMPTAQVALAAPTSGNGSSASSQQGTSTQSRSGSTGTQSGSATQNRSNTNSQSGQTNRQTTGNSTYNTQNNTSGSQTAGNQTQSQQTTQNAQSTTDTQSDQAETTSSGSARHQTDRSHYSLNALSTNYLDADNKLQTRHKDVIAINFTGGLDEQVQNLDRIATFYEDEQKGYPVSYLMDTGNASAAAPYSAIFGSQAPLFRMMGAAGYDIAGIGSGELTFGVSEMVQALNRAVSSGDVVPYLANANVSVSGSLKSAYEKFGIEPYTVISKYGKKVAVFSVMSKEAFNQAGVSGLKYKDAAKTAKSLAAKIQKEEKPDLVVCLANTMSSKAASQAKAIADVDGVDLVLTGGGTGKEPAVENGTNATIVQSSNADTIGTVEFKLDGNTYKYDKVRSSKLSSYEKKASVTSEIERFEKLSNEEYFSRFGLSYSKQIIENSINFGTMQELTEAREDLGLTNLLTDSYIYGVRSIAGIHQNVTVAVMSPKVVSEIPGKGTWTAADVYSALGGGSSDGTSGRGLTYFYLTGNELKNLAELTSSESRRDTSKRLFFGGLTYVYNPHRLLGNKVYHVRVKTADGESIKPVGSKRYLVVADSEAEKVIRKISNGRGQSLKVSMKDYRGKALQSPQKLKHSGSSVKVWGAAARYVNSLGSSIPQKYSKTGTRMVYDGSFLPSHLLKETNSVAGVIIAVVVIVIAVIILLIILLLHIFRGGRRGGGFGGRRKHNDNIFGGGRGRKTRYPKRRRKERSIFTKK